MWCMKSKIVKGREYRFKEKIKKLEEEQNELCEKFFWINDLFYGTYENKYFIDPEKDKSWNPKFRLNIDILLYPYFDTSKDTYYTDHEVIYNKVKELKEKFEENKIRLSKLKRFLYIIK
jgi:hypothetical protein